MHLLKGEQDKHQYSDQKGDGALQTMNTFPNIYQWLN